MDFKERFYEKLHTRSRVPRNELEAVKNQEQNQIFHAKRNMVYMPIIERRPDFFQIDTTFYPLKGKKRAIFTAINVNTKAGFIAPYNGSSPTSQQTVSILQKLIREFPVKNIGADNGSEFIGKNVEAFLKSHNINLYFYTPYDSKEKAIIERFNSTVKDYLNKVSYSINANWLPYINDIILAYNSTPHSSTGKAPYKMTEVDVENYIVKQDQRSREYREYLNRFQPGTKVRIFRTADPTLSNKERQAEKQFGKKDYPQWSQDVHTVESIDRFKVRLQGLDERFSPRDLLIIDETQIEKHQPTQQPTTKKQARQIRNLEDIRRELGDSVVEITGHGYAEIQRKGKNKKAYITEFDTVFEGNRKPRTMIYKDLITYPNGKEAFKEYLESVEDAESEKILKFLDGNEL